MKNNKGFTLIEILIVIGIMAILAAIVIIAINPAAQFADARDAQRKSDVRTILNAMHQNVVKNKGTFDWSGPCTETEFPTDATEISDTGFDVCGCLVADFIAAMPVDPGTGSAPITEVDCAGTYATGYYVREEANGRLTVSSTSELANDNSDDISATR